MTDWTQPPLVHAPGDLGPVLIGAHLNAVENDRAARTVRLHFDLLPDAGTSEAIFTVEAATHLLGFAYLPPFTPLDEGLSPEETMASVGGWARQGLVAALDPLTLGTPLIVQRARLHAKEETTVLTIEGYGEDPDLLVWWELRVGGARLDTDA